jgi:hypothetical protein
MGAALNDRLGSVRAMLETAPDAAVRDLDRAMRADASESLAPVRELVRVELSDRAARDAVLAPLIPLCAPRADGFKQVLFPAGTLSRLWRALRALEPTMVTVAASNLTLSRKDEILPPECDALCRAAAAALKRGDPAMQGLTRFLEDYQAGTTALFAAYVELIPVARAGVRRLPAWLRDMSDDHAAAVRLLFKDAAAVAEDASPRMWEILLAHAAEPWTLLRVVSAVTHHGGDSYVFASELAECCERLMADIERRVNVLRQFEVDGGPEAGEAAAGAVAVAISEIQEFEASLDLNKDGPWGTRLARLRESLHNLVESHLKRTPKIVGEALPLQQVRIGGMKLRMEPRLDQPPDARLVRRAITSLTFFDRARAAAAQAGYETIRAKAGEDIANGLKAYVEDILGLIHSGELDTLDHAHAFLDVAADMTALAQDEKSAQIVRRRAAAA